MDNHFIKVFLLLQKVLFEYEGKLSQPESNIPISKRRQAGATEGTGLIAHPRLLISDICLRAGAGEF